MTCVEYLKTKGVNLQGVGVNKFRANPCPFCGHNDCFTIFNDTNSWYCFSEERGGGLKEFKRAFGEEIEEEEQEGKIQDFTYLIEALHDLIARTDYYKRRGLDKTIKKYKLGYSVTGLNYLEGKIPNLRISKDNEHKAFYSCYKFILPIWDVDGSCRYFITRRDDEEAMRFKEKYKKDIPKTYNLAGLPSRIFNDRYLKVDNPPHQLFVVEGIFDALSLEEEGYNAIALNSVSNFSKFNQLVKEYREKLQDTEFIVVPDNDDAGRSLTRHFKEDFIFNSRILKLPDCKDTNEYFIKHGQLKEDIEDLLSRREAIFWVTDYIYDFLTSMGNQKIISTGFTKLDELLGGGLRSGLTILGGLTSLGKTSLALQLTKNIAEQNIPAFYFALEEGRNDLIGKLFSCIAYEYGIKISSLDLMRRTFKEKEEDLKLLIEKFRVVGERIAIFEGTFQTTVEAIREEVERYTIDNETSPVVIVDYIQILKAPDGGFRTDKQALDFAVSELKRIARDFNCVVIGISSINRGSYGEAFSYEALKESGGIEYTADTILGLQLPAEEKGQKTNTAERVKNIFKNEPVSLELKILKNRYGRAHEVISLSFYPKYSFFEEGK